MEKKDTLTKLLAVIGTIFVWTPILFMIIASIIGSLSNGTFLFDFLIPAELFPIVLAGALLLLLAAFRAHSQRKIIGWSLAAMLVFLFGGQGLAVLTGLASGAVDPSNWIFGLVVSTIALYSGAIIVIGIAGILLVKQLYRK